MLARMSVAAVFLLVAFGAMLVVSVLMGLTAHRGQVCTRGDGYDVPDRVRQDPELRARANEEVGRAAVLAGLLSLAPMVFAGWLLLRPGDHEVSTGVLAACAAYGLFVVVVGRLPSERMKRW